MPPFHFAHLTDLHARQAIPGTSIHPDRHSRAGFTLLKQAINQAREAGAEALCFTGDLLDVPDDWLAQPLVQWPREAIRQTQADYLQAYQILETSGLPWLALPGNHDQPELFAEVFESGLLTRSWGNYAFVGFTDWEGEGHVPHRTDTLAEHWQALLQAGPTRQVHLQHYVLTPFISHPYPHNYPQGETWAKAMAASGRVVLSLSGHWHTGSRLSYVGPSGFAVGQAMCTPPHPWYLYTLHEQQVSVFPHHLD